MNENEKIDFDAPAGNPPKTPIVPKTPEPPKQPETPAVIPPTNQQVAKQTKTQAERFTDMVVREFSQNAGEVVKLTDFQKRLCTSYFIAVDSSLKKAEVKRLTKSEQYRDSIPVTWDNVNMPQLAVDVVACARIELDPAQNNHIAMIPYKNNSTNKYDINFTVEYKGCQLKATKYGLDSETPDDVIIELKYKNDVFKVHKKDKNNPVESYEFEMVDPFNRGEIVGGFYYYNFFKTPEKNFIKAVDVAWIEKRKPKNASAEFWGGTKDKWEKDKNGKNVKVGTEDVEGWKEEMYYKTIYRAAYNAITIDSKKIDDNYVKLSQIENSQNLFSEPEPEKKLLDIPITHCEDITPKAKKEVKEVKFED